MKRLISVLALVLASIALPLVPASAHGPIGPQCFRAEGCPSTPIPHAAHAARRTLPPNVSGYPTCVTTTWAAKHYGVAKTPRGAICFLPFRKVPNTPGTSANVTSYEPAWAPSSWQWLGLVYDGDRLAGVVVQRPAR